MDRETSRDIIERVVRRLGFTNTYSGTPNLVDAVQICYNDPGLLTAVTKEVYPMVARKADCHWKNVERNLRTASEACWNRGNRTFLNEMAGFELQTKPTTGELINYIVGYLKDNHLLDGVSSGAQAPAAASR